MKICCSMDSGSVKQTDAVYAIYKDGTKQWMIDPPHFDGMVESPEDEWCK